ncbi:phosphoglycolate phosphatase [Bacillus sp. DX4.1]|uniref:phosphoglycolate phosphatase n=1 Tax=Bacillus sp. DX4.1 TaxID=3055867 RepID=UPI0025A1D122|nr:phosphoglycolate phosphatase [Bacillus sp. DX4.1]MDM5186059.1 phosphoglycolate phosphatase [Bacillus sp. DX4.1]
MLLTLGAYVYAIMDYGTPDEFSKEAWPKTEETAKLATIEHFKKENNVDVTITSIGHSGEYATPEIYLEGHVAGNEQQKIAATVNSAENYKVKDTSKD